MKNNTIHLIFASFVYILCICVCVFINLLNIKFFSLFFFHNIFSASYFQYFQENKLLFLFAILVLNDVTIIYLSSGVLPCSIIMSISPLSLFNMMLMSLNTVSGSSKLVSHSAVAGDVIRPSLQLLLHIGIAVDVEDDDDDDVEDNDVDCGNSWRFGRRCLIVPAFSLANGILSIESIEDVV